jgi:hypothetical protein
MQMGLGDGVGGRCVSRRPLPVRPARYARVDLSIGHRFFPGCGLLVPRPLGDGCAWSHSRIEEEWGAPAQDVLA